MKQQHDRSGDRVATLTAQLPPGAVWPDYGAGGLFALVHSFRRYLAGEVWCSPLQPSATAGAPGAPAAPRDLVFLLVDGLGDDFLQRHGAGSALLAARQGRLSSVFPSTTASAVTTLLTGLAPGQHGLTGWHIFDQRFGGVLAPLPMCLLDGGAVRGWFAVPRLFPYRTLFQAGKRAMTVVQPANLTGSVFMQRHGRGARIVPYANEAECVEQVVQALNARAAADGAWVHAYYPRFDSISHHAGCDSPQAQAAFRRADRLFVALLAALQGRNVDIVVTADHGFIDSPPEQCLFIQDAGPAVLDRLAAPLTGERRAAFCHVRPGSEAAFATALQDWLGARGRVIRSADLLAAGWFGPPPFHARIHERIGTFTVVMAEGWTLLDVPPGQTPHEMLGVHGGVSAREMWVPLCVAALQA